MYYGNNEDTQRGLNPMRKDATINHLELFRQRRRKSRKRDNASSRGATLVGNSF